MNTVIDVSDTHLIGKKNKETLEIACQKIISYINSGKSLTSKTPNKPKRNIGIKHKSNALMKRRVK